MEINRGLFDALGMTVIDSLWQGAIVMSLAFLGLWFMKKSKASLRHNFLLICILALPILGIYSFSQRFESASSIVDTVSTNEEMISGITSMESSPESMLTSLPVQSDAFEWVEMIPWVGFIWAIGLVLILIRSAGAYLYLNRLKNGAIDIVDDEIMRQFNKLKDGFDLKGQVMLKESTKISGPMVYGYFKPIILFPLGLIQGLSMDELEVILLHELAHLKRNDFLINIVINGLRAVYFYHPVFWWLQSQLDNEREFASDEMVMERKTDGLVLVRALTKAQEFSMLSPSLGFAGSSKNQLLKRVNRIMKKQQKPNWTGLLLPCAILLSVFLLSSQSDANKQVTDNENVLEQTDTVALRRNFKLPTEDEVRDAKLNYRDSLGNRHVSLVNDQDDTFSIAKATMELLEDPSPVTVTVSMGDGMPVGFSKNGRTITGDEFKVYEEAYLKLNKYASDAAEKRMSGFMGAKYQQMKEVPKRSSNDASVNQNIKLRNTGLPYLYKIESLLVQEKALFDKVVAYATTNPSKAQAKLLNEQMDKVIQLEKLIDQITVTMDAEQKQVYKLYHQNREQLADVEEHIEIRNKLNQISMQMDSTLKAEQNKFDQMVMTATANPDEADPVALNKQALRVSKLEKEYLAYPTKFNSNVQEVQKRQETVQQRKRQQQLIKEQVSTHQTKYDNLGGTGYTEDGKSFDFHLGREGLEAGLDEYRTMQDAGDRPILEIDGVLMPDAKLSDFNEDEFVSITIYKGKAQQKRYPNGETKGRNGLIAIKTFEGMTGLRLKGNGTVSTKTFSKDKSNYTFAEDNKGQSQAMSTLEAARALEENYVIAFNGKFMPKDPLLKYADAYIKEINIYKGEALKKFPKRKVKDHATIIEVITKKMPRRKN